MKCEEFKEYINGDRDTENTEGLREHLEKCEECRDTMGLLDRLSAAGPREAPPTLRKKVMNCIQPPKKISFMKKHKKNLMRIAAIVVAGVFVGLTLTVKITSLNGAKAAQQIMNKAKESLAAVKTMIIEIDVRTPAGSENPKDIVPAGNMTRCHIQVENGDKVRGMIVKGGRKVFTENGNLQLIRSGDINIIMSDPTLWTGWFTNLIDPGQLYENLAKSSASSKKELTDGELTGIEITAVGGDGTVFGDFAGIDGKKVISRFYFDKENGLLQSVKVIMEEGNNLQRTILESRSIKYNVPVDIEHIPDLSEYQREAFWVK